MGTSYVFVLEEQTGDSWHRVERLGPLEGREIHRRDGSFIRAVTISGPSSRELCYRLFDDGPFRFQRSEPPARDARLARDFGLFRNGPPSFGVWAPVADLELPTWPERSVHVGARVPIDAAIRFEDGDLLSPSALLDELGVSANVVSPSALDYGGGLRHRLHQPTRDSKIDVTWRVPLLEVGGPLWREGFDHLAMLPDPERYRLLTATG